MIDTDKYEGHTHQDQWYAEEDWKNMIGLKTEDALLTADAPLLLAEVKRLHSLDDLLRSMRKDGIGASYDDHQLAEVKRLQKRNEWLEEVVALLQEDGIDLSMEGYPLWEGEEE